MPALYCNAFPAQCPPPHRCGMSVSVITGDCRDVLKTLPDQSVNCCVTSPPYFGLRNYGHARQIGLEATPDAFVAEMVAVFAEVRRVLRDDGTLWLNLGDSYAGSGKGQTASGANDPKNNKTKGMKIDAQRPSDIGLKAKDLIGIPWRVAFALQAEGWYLRRDIIWHKPNPMPESVTDRCTSAHEYIFHFSKSPKYYYDADAIAEDAIYAGLTGQDASGYKDAKKFAGKHSDKHRGHSRRHAGFNDRLDAMERTEQCSGKRNKRSVWTVATKPFKEAHFATFPPDLIEPCVLAGCPEGGTVLDPFGGAGTTGLVADRNGRNAILIELNPKYGAMAEDRILTDAPLFNSPHPAHGGTVQSQKD
jgi:DNA modification methylase